MTGTTFLISPEAPAGNVSTGHAPRRLKDQTLRMGVLDNGKGNADNLLRFVLEGLKSAHPASSVVWLRKDSMSTPATASMLDQLVTETDLVISAMGD